MDLLPFVRSQRSLPADQLIDMSVRPEPVRQKAPALFAAWILDWYFAVILASGLVDAWLMFLENLAFPLMSYQAEGAFLTSARTLLALLPPCLFFGMTYLGISLGGQTLGMRLMKHQFSKELKGNEALLWSLGAMVSVAAGGLTLLFRKDGSHLLDHMAGVECVTVAHAEWSAEVPPAFVFDSEDKQAA